MAGAPGRGRVPGGVEGPPVAIGAAAGGVPGPVEAAGGAGGAGAGRIALAMGVGVAMIGATAAGVSSVSMRAPLAPDLAVRRSICFGFLGCEGPVGRYSAGEHRKEGRGTKAGVLAEIPLFQPVVCAAGECRPIIG